MNDISSADINFTLSSDHTGASVDGASLLTEIADTIGAYVVASRDQLIALALWIVHTHAIDAAVFTPYLAILSAAKRCGKTTLLEVLELLVARPWLTGRVSAAVLVRKTDKERPTLLLDESDAMFAGEKEYAEALRGILNTGFKAGGKTSLCIGQGANISYKDFHTFGAKAIAGIGKLPDTVMDRAIPITLKRKSSTEQVERFRARKVREVLDPLRTMANDWALAHVSDLRGREPHLPDELNDRAQDVWEPLFSIADEAGGDWPRLARKAAVTLSGDAEGDDDISVQLLTDCKVAIADLGNPETIAGKQLVDHLVAIEDRPWAAWSGGRPISQAKVARILAGFGIHSHDIKFSGKTLKGYTVRTFDDAWIRYIPIEKPQLRNTPNRSGPESVILKAQPDDVGCGPKSTNSPINTGLSCGVAVSEPNPGMSGQRGGGDRARV